MGPTLFRYIFWDLLRIFTMAAVVIAAIMSFAGLLRPLTERGLDGGQVLRVLVWLLPAMATYALPVAALFATTFVYGRLAADNETTAVRAAGISRGLTGLAMPALLLGVLACVGSLGLLWFIVPAANLRVERVIYSNLARLSANEINRTKRLNFQGAGSHLAITAHRAVVLDPAIFQTAGLPPETQIVQLEDVYVLRYENVGERTRYDVPRDIYNARFATAYITPPGELLSGPVFRTALRDDQFLLTVVLQRGVKFPRVFSGLDETPLVGAIHASQIGPLALNSPVRENTKFLDIRELYRLYARPELGRSIGRLVGDMAQREQRAMYLRQLQAQASEGGVLLMTEESIFTFSTEEATGGVVQERLRLGVEDEAAEVRLVQQRPGGEVIRVVAPRVTVTADPVGTGGRQRVLVVFTFENASVTIQPEGGEPVTTTGRTFERRALVEMPEAIARLGQVGAVEFLQTTAAGNPDSIYVRTRLRQQQNAVLSEIWARWSFAVSCLVLPVVGGLLGMMFRSGNFLTAFGVSVAPALLSIVLIVVGQQVAQNPPALIDGRWTNPLAIGLPLIWAGNATVALIIASLLWRLQRA